MRQETLNEDKSHIKAKTNKLYHQGAMESDQHVLTTISNFWIFTHMVVEDFDTNKPAIWEAFQVILSAMMSSAGKTWCRQHINQYHVFYHLLNDVQLIVNLFTTLARNYQLLGAVKTGRDIDPNTYQTAILQARSISQRFLNTIATGDLGEYRWPPPIMSQVCPKLH